MLGGYASNARADDGLQACGALLTCDPCADNSRNCRLVDGSGRTSDVYVERCNAHSPSAFPLPVAADCCPNVICEPCSAGHTSCRIVGPQGNLADVYIARCAGTTRPVQNHPPLPPPTESGAMCGPQILCEPCDGGQHTCRVVNGAGKVSDVYVEKCGH